MNVAPRPALGSTSPIGPLIRTSGDSGPAPWTPAQCVLQRRSSNEVRADARFEFCRAIAVGSHIERPLGTSENFQGDFAYAVTRSGIGYARTTIDACVSRFGVDGNDSVVDVAMLDAGTMRIQHGRDQRLVLNAGIKPVLFDPARPLTIKSSRTEFAVLRLPRARVTAALGTAAAAHMGAVRPLSSTVLGNQLAACFKSLACAVDHATSLSTSTIETATALTLVMLAGARGPDHHWPGELHAALYRAACHQLALGVANPALTVDAVAATLGCSRAQLYRLFAEHGQSVADELNRLRMQQAGSLLRGHGAIGIGIIAARCGYTEPAAFDKAFRRHYGMTPRDWRALAPSAATTRS